MPFITEELIDAATRDPDVLRRVLREVNNEFQRLDATTKVALELVNAYMPAFPAGETLQPEIGVSIRGGVLYKAAPVETGPILMGVTVYSDVSGRWRIALGGAAWWRTREHTVHAPETEMFLVQGGLITAAAAAGAKVRVGRVARSEPGRALIIIDPMSFWTV